MSDFPSNGYYVRVRGRIQGPFDLARLKVLRARGQFSRVFEVSEDRRTWVSSETLTELLDPPPPPQPETPIPEEAWGQTPTVAAPFGGPSWDSWEPRRRRDSDRNLGTILLVALLVLVPAGIIGGLVLMQRLDRRQQIADLDTDVVLTEEPMEQPEPVPDLGATATFDYWSAFMTNRSSLALASNATAADVASRCRRVSAEALAQPTLHVDQEAVQFVLDYSAALTQLAAAAEAANDPSNFIEAFLRGADGDPFGKALELKASQDEALRQLQSVEHRLATVRAALTSRYHRQFP